ncbi:MAG: hypothetical protein Kow0073_09680 [Immundisolibacter sp.]
MQTFFPPGGMAKFASYTSRWNRSASTKPATAPPGPSARRTRMIADTIDQGARECDRRWKARRAKHA